MSLTLIAANSPRDGAATPAWVSSPWRYLLAAAAAFLLLVLFGNLGHLRDLGRYVYWQDWADQQKYITSARAFARGDLSPDQHWYPLLYSLAMVPFLWLPLFYAVLIVNVACYGLTYVGFSQVAARFGLSSFRALTLFLATTLFGSSLARSWTEPWTTTLSAALIWLSLGRLCVAFGEDEAQAEPRSAFLTGALLGLIPLCRPADFLVCAILGAFQLFWMARSANSLRVVSAFLSGGLGVGAAYGALYLAIYGPHPTDYMKLSAEFGFNFAWLGWKTEMLLVEPHPFYPFGSGLLARFPWVLLGAAGMLVAATRRESRRLALMLVAPALAYAAAIIAYVDLLPSGLWAFHNFHYFKWLMPLLGLFAYDYVWSFRKAKAASLAALAVVIAATSFHYEAGLAAPNEPARLVTFAAPETSVAADVEFGRLYFGHSVVTDDAGLQRNTYEYRQTPDARGLVYAEALRRDFQGGEHWTDSPDGVDWPKVEAHPQAYPPVLGGVSRAPVGRFRPRLAFGWPCWLPVALCDLKLPGAGR